MGETHEHLDIILYRRWGFESEDWICATTYLWRVKRMRALWNHRYGDPGVVGEGECVLDTSNWMFLKQRTDEILCFSILVIWNQETQVSWHHYNSKVATWDLPWTLVDMVKETKSEWKVSIRVQVFSLHSVSLKSSISDHGCISIDAEVNHRIPRNPTQFWKFWYAKSRKTKDDRREIVLVLDAMKVKNSKI